MRLAIIFIQIQAIAGLLTKGKACSICKTETDREFYPMKQWGIEGPICGGCYSKRLHDHYPGEHVRVNNDKA